jgi:uncharacterized protein (DUF2062 family)
VIKLAQFFRNQYSKRVLIPVSNIRKQGFSSETLAFSIAIGVVGGAFPAIGFASYICLLMTLLLRQNIIIVQVVNWLVYPIQILLLIPFMKLGHSIFAGGDVVITLHQVTVAFQVGIMNGFREIGIISLYGIIAWAACAIPSMFILYTVFLIFFKTMKRIKLKAAPASLVMETVSVKSNSL